MNKQELRERVWDELEESGQARFPFPPHGRIPNFAGADDAADRLADLDAWQAADAIKANPRRAAATGPPTSPCTRARRSTWPSRACATRSVSSNSTPNESTTSTPRRRFRRWASTGGRWVPRDVEVGRLRRLGQRRGPRGWRPHRQGRGYSDLEYAVLRELGLVDDETPVATTVHEMQVQVGAERE